MGGVLLVDDSLFMRLLYKKILDSAGMAIAGEAGNGYEAILKYAELKPDAVIMDINMPGMSGIEAMFEILKADPEARIIISSAMGQEAFVRESILGGAKAFVVKPIVEKVFLDTLRHVMR